MNFGEKVISFYENLVFPDILPEEIEVMVPFANADTADACRIFYRKYYSDLRQRHLIIGINPGRFGAGITGIPFTDPIRLATACGIENNWQKKQELSSVFVYEMINAFGGVEKFYKSFYITAVSPLGFTRAGKNLNYYDDRTLQESIRPFVIDCLRSQLDFGVNRDVAFCLGDGKNYKFLSALNKKEKFFKDVIPLSHPRFIMQYKLRKKDEYVQRYVDALTAAVES